jgi:hypothetical protein
VRLRNRLALASRTHLEAPCMKRFALIASILAATTACDKPKVLSAASRPSGEGARTSRLDLSKRPDIVFQLFGERDDPRMIPFAAIVNGVITPIDLSAPQWRTFDAMYARADTSYPLYHDGAQVGSARIRRGMWGKRNDPLYSLPGCTLLMPLAAVTLETSARVGFSVDFLAATPGISVAPRPAATESPELEQTARALVAQTAREAGMEAGSLSKSAFRYYAIHTRAGVAPTIVASVLDPEASDRSSTTSHVFVIGDQRDASYAPSYQHSASGRVANGEYRRYLDHLDINGDGIDEILVEGWRFGGDSYLIVLGIQGGAWREILRGRPSWCLDKVGS